MKYLIPLFCLLLLTACDPGTSYERYLMNQTDKQITITFHHQYPSYEDFPQEPVVAAPHTTTLLFKDAGLGGKPEPENPMERIDSVDVFIEGAVLQKDLMKAENWFVDIQPNGGVGAKKNYKHKYTFVVVPAELK